MQYKFSLVDRKIFTPEILVLFGGFCGCFFYMSACVCLAWIHLFPNPIVSQDKLAFIWLNWCNTCPVTVEGNPCLHALSSGVSTS